MTFRDRVDAGRQLAAALASERVRQPVVIGLPRGGVPVAREVAQALHAPLDVIVVRKLGVPGHEELGMGAISEDDVVVFNQDVIDSGGIGKEAVDAALARERRTLDARRDSIRAAHAPVPLKGRTVIVVDDGIATGVDARAACRVARSRGAARVVLAVPVAPADWRERLAREADAFVAVEEDPFFAAVGAYYDDFSPTSDDEVLQCLTTTS